MLWSGYALSLLAAWQGAALRARPLAAAILTTATAIAFSPLPCSRPMSTPTRRMDGFLSLYGQNPYLCLPIYLQKVGDSVAPYLVWNWPRSTLGVDTDRNRRRRPFACGRAVAADRRLEAGSGRRTGCCRAGGPAHHPVLSPGRENLTLLAIGLNPLLLLEGPGSGHNDLLMVSFLLIGAMFYLEKKYLLAALFLGLSVGIKMVTLAVLPWV